MSKNILHKVVIEKLVPGGLGLGRLDEGIVVMVRYVLPGEQVMVRELYRKKQFIHAELVEILESSPDRKQPRCPLFSQCGGCDLQHTDYQNQLRLKTAMLVDNLQRANSETAGQIAHLVEPPIGSPETFGYRQRIRLHIDDMGRLGFYHPDSHILVPISRCLLANSKINQVLAQLDAAPGFTDLVVHAMGIELLYNPVGDDIMLLLHYNRKPRPKDRVHAKQVQEGIQAVSQVIMQVSDHGLFAPHQENCLSKPPILTQTLPSDVAGKSLSLSWEAGGFCQVNLQQNQTLIKLVIDLLDPGSQDRILDLFCGQGNFSLPIAMHGVEVVGLDGQGSAIRSARRNVQEAGITNCSFHKTSILPGVQQLVAEQQNFHTIIIDPPRQGAAEIMDLLPKLATKRIVYISCNPATLARDISMLNLSGYGLRRLAPVDMFPQTHHLECVALLELNSLSS